MPDLLHASVFFSKKTERIPFLWKFAFSNPTYGHENTSTNFKLPYNKILVAVGQNDCWYNPCDEHVAEEALFSFRLDGRTLPPGGYHKIRMLFDLSQRTAQLFVDGKKVSTCAMAHDYSIGLSYLHIQCDAPKPSEGLYIKYMGKK